MIREIYTRSQDDVNYKGDFYLDTNDEVEMIITQIRTLFGTGKGQVLGAYNFGLDIESLVFTTNFSNEGIKKKINEAFSIYISPFFPNHTLMAEVQFGHHYEGWDYAIIDIMIDEVKVIGFEIV